MLDHSNKWENIGGSEVCYDQGKLTENVTYTVLELSENIEKLRLINTFFEFLRQITFLYIINHIL